MLRRSSTIWLPRLAMTLLMLLVSHDVVMAMDPHNVEHAATLGEHTPAHDAPDSNIWLRGSDADAQAATCMSFEAARTGESVRVDGDLPSNVVTDSRCQVAESAAVAIDHDEPGSSPGQRRAMLQVYLN
ncbi:MAG: hypothetical protein H0U38_01665 [Chloroflexia bacterium]|nr:hypothetical protein [Chloroflexia bacterium]